MHPWVSQCRSYPLLLGFLDGGDLLRDDRQHFDVDAIEFVETRPRASTAVIAHPVNTQTHRHTHAPSDNTNPTTHSEYICSSDLRRLFTRISSESFTHPLSAAQENGPHSYKIVKEATFVGFVMEE